MGKDLISLKGVSKVYAGGFQALDGIDLEIKEGEILALLGPNGAGKTTMIGCICGLVNITSGEISVAGCDIHREFRKARSMIGLVPQELTADAFETVWNTVSFSRGLFGKAPDPAYLEQLLKDLMLWEKKDQQLMALSGGMKRRVLIAKALSHQPRVLFLDEPTAGVDVELRKSMWKLVHRLRKTGVTIILTTHYIEEAEEMADRVGVILKGKLLLVEEKEALIERFGVKRVRIDLRRPLQQMPESFSEHRLKLVNDGHSLEYTYQSRAEDQSLNSLFQLLLEHKLEMSDVHTKQSSLEDIFVELVQ